MKRRRSAPHTFEENIAAEKTKLEAQIAELKPGPEMDAIRKNERVALVPRTTNPDMK